MVVGRHKLAKLYVKTTVKQWLEIITKTPLLDASQQEDMRSRFI